MKKIMPFIIIAFLIALILSFSLYTFAFDFKDANEQEEYINVDLEDLEKFKNDENKLLKVHSLKVIGKDKNRVSEKLDLIKLCPNVRYIYLCVKDLDIDKNFLNSISSIDDVSISLQFVNVDLEGVTNKKITCLNLVGCNIINFSDISYLVNLKILNIESCEGFQTFGLKKLYNLEILNVSGQKIENYKIFFEEIKNIRELSLENSNLQNSDTIYIIELKELQKLNISGTFVNYIKFLKYLPNLERITLPYDVDSLDILYELPKLKSVGFDSVTETKVDENLVKYFDDNSIRYRKDFDKNIKDKLLTILDGFNFTEITSDKEKIEKVTDYVISNMKYSSEQTRTFYGSLDKTINYGYGVCHDYTILEYTLLTMSGIKAFYIGGYACNISINSWIKNIRGSHAWNVVCLDGEYYSIDATWCDSGGALNTDYYLRKLNTLSQEEIDEKFNLMHLTYNNPIDTLL